MKRAAAVVTAIALLAISSSAWDFLSDTEVTLIETALPALSVSRLAKLVFPAEAMKEMDLLNLETSQIDVNPGHRSVMKGLAGAGFAKGAFNASLVAMVALNVADYLSTNAALKYPGTSENNPLMKPFVDNPYTFAAVKVGITALSYLSAKALYKKNKTLAWLVSTLSNVALGYAVSSNLRLIEQAKGL
jgi:hypothetical protein